QERYGGSWQWRTQWRSGLAAGSTSFGFAHGGLSQRRCRWLMSRRWFGFLATAVWIDVRSIGGSRNGLGRRTDCARQQTSLQRLVVCQLWRWWKQFWRRDAICV